MVRAEEDGVESTPAPRESEEGGPIRDSQEHVSCRALALVLPDSQVLFMSLEKHTLLRALALSLPGAAGGSTRPSGICLPRP